MIIMLNHYASKLLLAGILEKIKLKVENLVMSN